MEVHIEKQGGIPLKLVALLAFAALLGGRQEDPIGGQSLPWSDGTSTLCVKAPFQRIVPQTTGGSTGSCDGSLVLDFNAYLASHPSALGQPVSGGQGFNVQALIRDPSFPSGTLSDAVEFWLAP